MTNSKQASRFDRLYQQHLTELKLQGKADRTIQGYGHAIRRLHGFLGRCPDDVTVEELKSYFDWLVDERSWSAVKVDLNGIKFFHRHVLGKDLPWVDIVRPPKEQKLPDILTQDEIIRIIQVTELPRYRLFWLLVYSTGMRLTEALNLQVSDIDKDRREIHIRRGKGHKDRFVVLPVATYKALQAYWKLHRHPRYLFPGRSAADGKPAPVVMDKGTTQKVFAQVVKAAGIRKKVSLRNLRNSHATHLIEEGLSLSAVQTQLGHSCPTTTAKYVQMTERSLASTDHVVNELTTTVARACWGKTSEGAKTKEQSDD